ncbi:MAG: RnfABCDGE type electron transport complex subunit G [Ruminococcaceae bacterium]|nr:RnfABCDGE type electron transport complex subunit G [Oscillospiraceae bacterium]
MKNNSTWNDILKPVVVLTAICLVVSGLLGLTNNITAPIIAENARLAADAARIELLPEATDGFELVEGVDMEGVTEVYKAKNGVGYTITAFGKGYGGNVNYMVAFDNDGKIVNLKVLSHEETAGLGSKIENPEFLAKFKGTDKELTSGDIDMIGGATISSNASLDAVNTARKAFNQYAKGIVVVELTLEEKLGQLFGEDVPAAVLTTEYTHADAVEFWQTEKGLIVVTEGKGNGIIGDEHPSGKMLKGYVAFDENGAVLNVMYDAAASETKGLGTKVEDPAYIANFIGMTSADQPTTVDVIANCTYSSKGAMECVAKAITVYNEIK